MLAANVPVLIERNELLDSREAAMQLMGAGAIVRGNRISGGAGDGHRRGERARRSHREQRARRPGCLRHHGQGLGRHAACEAIACTTAAMAWRSCSARSPSTAIDNTIIEPKFNGIDVIGDSPVLRGNQVLRPRALALKVVDFTPEGGEKVRSQPFLEGNNFDARGTIIATGKTAASADGGLRR